MLFRFDFLLHQKRTDLCENFLTNGSKQRLRVVGLINILEREREGGREET